MAAQLDSLDTDLEKVQWLAGFRVGSRGGQQVEGWSQAKLTGFLFGLAALREAEAFSARQAENGAKAAFMRKQKTPLPEPVQPAPTPQRRSSTAPAPLEHRLSEPPAPLRPPSEHRSSPSNIQYPISNSEEASSQEPPAPPPRPNPDFFDGMDRDETEIVYAKPVHLEVSWRDWRLHHGSVFVGRHGDGDDDDAWARAWKLYGQDIFDVMYSALAASGKRVYYTHALQWFEKNTKDQPAV